VFEPDPAKSSAPAPGPRFVLAAGRITQECQSGVKAEITAVVPTGAVITGPEKLQLGKEQLDPFRAYLTADGKELDGEPTLDWQLGADCNGVAIFADVLGAQDTGGADRTRRLITKGKGMCTVTVTVSTHSALDTSFKGQAFKAERRVTIE
jgi:hypothetical protein